MPPKKVSMKDAILDAIERVAKEKCSQEFDLKDFKQQTDAIVKATGTKAKKPEASINQQLLKLVDEGMLTKSGRGKFTIVAGAVRKPSGKRGRKASKKKPSAKKTVAKKPSAKKTVAKKSVGKKKPVTGGKRKRKAKTTVARRHGPVRFQTYIYKVLKTVVGKDSETGISRKAMDIMSSLTNDLLTQLGHRASELAQRVGRKTVNARDIQSATQFVLNGELTKHAVGGALKAVMLYDESKGGSATERAGLVFSVPRTERFLRAMMPHTNISATAPVFAAAVIEYIIAEVIELSSNAAKDHKRKRIVPRHIVLAIRNDEELAKTFKNVIFAQGGVLPNIHSDLLPPRPKKQRTQ